VRARCCGVDVCHHIGFGDARVSSAAAAGDMELKRHGTKARGGGHFILVGSCVDRGPVNHICSI
jgi:hypothetical protein